MRQLVLGEKTLTTKWEENYPRKGKEKNGETAAASHCAEWLIMSIRKIRSYIYVLAYHAAAAGPIYLMEHEFYC